MWRIKCDHAPIADVYEVGRNMFVERKLNPSTGAIELWWCDWEKGSMAGLALKKPISTKSPMRLRRGYTHGLGN